MILYKCFVQNFEKINQVVFLQLQLKGYWKRKKGDENRSIISCYWPT